MNLGNILLILIGARIGIKSIKKYITRPRKLKMELEKYSNTDMVKVIDLPDELYTGNDEDIKDNLVYKKVYDEFCKTIEEEVPRSDLDNYYRNFKTITETQTPPTHMLNHLMKGELVGGSYNIEDNKIDLETSKLSKLMNSRCHELMHAASTRVDKEKNIIYSGFSQMYLHKEDPKKTEVYGIGINEGVTQYLTNEYFPLDTFSSYSVYREEQAIAEGLEKIVGEETFRSLYFRSDLKGLVNILEQYVTKEEIYKFINYTDVLFYYSRDKELKFDKLNEVKKFINLFLIKAYTKAHNNEINPDRIMFEMNGIPYKNVK